MPDLVAFLTARLDEEERAADLISAGGYQPQRWIVRGDFHELWPPEIIGLDKPIGAPDDEQPEEFRVALAISGRNEAQHIARWDPARVLAEIAAKRALIDHVARYEARRDSEWGCCHDAEQILAGECPEINTGEIKALRLLAAPYASHADFDESWRT